MRHGFRILAWAFVVGYVAFVLYVTVFGRAETEEIKYNFMPFWSYVATYKGEGVNLMRGNYMNVLMFVPLGSMLWFAMKEKKWMRALVVCCIVSACVEALQLLLRRGFCEFDDVMHNALGGMIGFFVCSLLFRKRAVREESSSQNDYRDGE